MTNQEVLRLLQAERIASELSTTRPISDPVTELVVRWYELQGVVQDKPDDAEAWQALLDLADTLATLTP